MTMRAAETMGMLGLAAGATAIAALTGTVVLLIVGLPFSLIAVIIFPILLFGVALVAILAAPVTIILFPLAYPFLRERPALAQVAYPALGAAGGGVMGGAWIAMGVLPNGPNAYEFYSAIGALSGLVAGACFGRGLHP